MWSSVPRQTAPFPKCAGWGGWRRWISCGFVSWPGVSLADHAEDRDGAKEHLRMAKHIRSGNLAHFWAFLTLPSPSRGVHEAAVSLSQPSFILRVTVMATNPTLPSVGALRSLEEFFWRGQKFLGSFQGCAGSSGGEGGRPKSPCAQHQDK